MTEELSPLELLRRENELLRETINSADSAIEELEAQLQVSAAIRELLVMYCLLPVFPSRILTMSIGVPE